MYKNNKSYLYVYEVQCAYNYIYAFVNEDIDKNRDMFFDVDEELKNILKYLDVYESDTRLVNAWFLPLDIEIYCYKIREKHEDYIIISPVELKYIEKLPVFFGKYLIKKTEVISKVQEENIPAKD